MYKSEIEVDRLDAVSDIGNEYEVIVLQKVVSSNELGSGDAHELGTKRAITSCGLSLNTNDGQVFKIIQTDQIIRKL